MTSGTIIWWNVDRGWGMARPDCGADIFVHHAALADDADLRRGDRVQFESVPGYIGMVAANVERLVP